MRKVLIHNVDDDVSEYLSEYKNLEMINLKDLKEVKNETIYYDGTTTGSFFNKFKEKYKLKDFPYLFNTTFIKYEEIKVIRIPDFRNYIFYKNKNRFDIEKQNELKEKHDIVYNVLEKTLEKYTNTFEKELNELPSNTFDITDISNGENKIWFVKDIQKQFSPNGKVLDYKSMLLLMELKKILKHEII